MAAVNGVTVPRLDAVQALSMAEVAPGIYVHVGVHEDISVANQGAIATIGFIVGQRSVAVVDPGGSPAESRALQAAIRSVTELPITHVVLTHAHPDHILGVVTFSDQAEVIAHSAFPTAFAQRADFYLQRYRVLFAEPPEVDAFMPDRVVDADAPLNIDLGRRQLEIRAWPVAHTDHDVTVFDRSTRTLFASDLLFRTRLPSLDGSLRGWLQVVEELATYDPALVVPGHGEPGSYAEIAAPQQRYLSSLLENTRAELLRGTPLSKVVTRVPLPDVEAWELIDLHHPGNVTRAYTELEWE